MRYMAFCDDYHFTMYRVSNDKSALWLNKNWSDVWDSVGLFVVSSAFVYMVNIPLHAIMLILKKTRFKEIEKKISV